MKVDLHIVVDINVSEAKCKKAKRKIIETLDSSFVDSYNKLEGYAIELRSCNLGSDIVIDLSKEALSNDKVIKRTWTWFMKHSLELQNGEGLTFISDMHKGLFDVVSTLLPEAHPRYCARHIEANWCKRWGKESLNAWILEARYKPIIGMLEDIRVKIMKKLAAKEVVVRKWKDDEFSLKS
ncbi:hypothetical protein MTR67_034924 [Solanum verrucosum]|uniref:MULE transposase domain-containing protein n=1 Tax=Solanum verrucosum TaxID=315347 RepID=A0AAF0ZLT3_SOLVR|nr:hypothetical protein MTR67_034924 [Solanum verrucosum]